MRLSIACMATGLLSLTVCHPLSKRANMLPPVASAVDESVVQLALYLEHLEFALYSGGFDSFTDAEYTAAGFPPGFREQIGITAQQELVHAQTLTNILTAAGYSPVPPCTYNFPYNSPTSFVDLANMVTSVGIGAYLGGGALLTDDPSLLLAASSILTVEARHDAYLRAGLVAAPFPLPFDTALTAEFAYNIAQPLIAHCPQQLPIPILPKLTLSAPPASAHLIPVSAGTILQFTYDPSTFQAKVDPTAPLYIGLINAVTNVTYVEVTSCGTGCAEIPVPVGAGSAAYAVLTTYNAATALTEDQLSGFGTLAGPAEVILS